MVRPITSPCGGPPPNCGSHPRTCAERRHGLEQAVRQDQHCHDDVFGDCRLMAEHVANVTPFGTAPVSSRSSPAATDCSRRSFGAGGNPAPPDMPDDDFRICQQRGKMRGVALIVEDRALKRRLHLGEDRARKGSPGRSRGYGEGCDGPAAPSRPPCETAPRIRTRANRKRAATRCWMNWCVRLRVRRQNATMRPFGIKPAARTAPQAARRIRDERRRHLCPLFV